MLFNGEEVGDGRGPGVRRRRRPDRRHHADGQGHAQRDRRDRGRRARRHVRPVGGLLHGQARHRPRGRGRRRHHRAGAENIARVAKAKGARARGRHRRASSTGRGTRTWCSEVRDAGARIKFITDGDVAGAIMAAREGTGVDLLLGIGGTPEGDHRRLRADLHGRRAAGPALATRRRRAAEGPRRRSRPRPGAHHRDLVGTDNVFFAATGVTDGELMRGVRYRAGGAPTQSIVMRGKSGTIRLGGQLALADQAPGVLVDRLRRARNRAGRLIPPRPHGPWAGMVRRVRA